MTTPTPDTTPDVPDVTEALREAFPAIRVTLSGRTWIEVPPEQRTVEYDVAGMRLMRDSGLDKLDASDLDLRSEEATQSLLRRILEMVLLGGKFLDLLGIMLVEEGGQPWSPAVAAQNARRFAAITDPAEKQQLYDLAARLVLSFSLAAIASIGTSPSFSALAEIGEAAGAADAPEGQ